MLAYMHDSKYDNSKLEPNNSYELESDFSDSDSLNQDCSDGYSSENIESYYDHSESCDSSDSSCSCDCSKYDQSLKPCKAGKDHPSENYIKHTYKLRKTLATDVLNSKPIIRKPNKKYKYVNLYSKGLLHDKHGYVDSDQMITLVKSIKKHDTNLLNSLKLGGDMKLVNPTAMWSYELFGRCANTIDYDNLPTYTSKELAVQMVELYCMSLSRDIPFDQYLNNAIILNQCKYLNHLSYYPQTTGLVTPYNIFKGPTKGDLTGLYISQFLYQNIPNGAQTIPQKYNVYNSNINYMTSWKHALSLQNGITPKNKAHSSHSRYIITGRDLATYVHKDFPYQAYINASQILLGLNVPLNKNIPTSFIESRFIDCGVADIQTCINEIGRTALVAAWNVKWVNLICRPEAYSIEVDRIKSSKNSKTSNNLKIHKQLLDSKILDDCYQINKSYLLSQVYPEGSPCHPSTPAGHATIAGACVTVLKFFFNTDYQIDEYKPNTDGSQLIKTGNKVTVLDELHKLASNISIGRNWAGIHYWMDMIVGVKIGEKIAINCLKELILRYPVKMSVSFKSFKGKTITINN